MIIAKRPRRYGSCCAAVALAPVVVCESCVSEVVCRSCVAARRWQYVHVGAWHRWAEAPVKIARMTLTIKLDRNWSSFQLANSAPPLSVTDSAIAPSARMVDKILRTCMRGICYARASLQGGNCISRHNFHRQERLCLSQIQSAMSAVQESMTSSTY